MAASEKLLALIEQYRDRNRAFAKDLQKTADNPPVADDKEYLQDFANAYTELGNKLEALMIKASAKTPPNS